LKRCKINFINVSNKNNNPHDDTTFGFCISDQFLQSHSITFGNFWKITFYRLFVKALNGEQRAVTVRMTTERINNERDDNITATDEDEPPTATECTDDVAMTPDITHQFQLHN